MRSHNNAIIYIYQNDTITEYPVHIGKVWTTFVEVTDPLPASLDIVTSSVENFDETKYKAVVGT